MPRIKVTRLRKFCGLLAGHSWRQAERVAQAAVELVRKWLPPGQDQLTLLDFQLYLAEALEENRNRLTAADNMHLHELQVDRELCQERTTATALVREQVLQLRDSLDGLFGPGGGAKVFEDPAPIPTDPVALAQFTGHLLANLANEDFPLPTPLQKAFTLDRKQAVADLEGPYRCLVSVLRKLENTESDSKYSQTHKDGRVSSAETLAFKVARFYEAFYALVGLDGLARRVRRSSHRTANGDEPEIPDAAGDDGEGEAPEAAAEASGATAESSTAAAAGG